MPLQLTAATSRVQKSSARRSSSSPFSSSKRRKPSSQAPAIKRTKSAPEEDPHFDAKLNDHGLVTSLARDASSSDIAQQIRWVSEHQWSDIPESGAGMNSTRIAEVLNFRRRLPPLVSVHHIHALSRYPTATEREIGTLVNAGLVRKIDLPAREIGGSSPGEALILVTEWERRVHERDDIEPEAKEKYVSLLKNPSVDVDFSQQEIAALVHAGFLIGSHHAQTQAELYLRPGASTLGNLQSVSAAGIMHASGSADAVADGRKHHIAGGSGFNLRVSNSKASPSGSTRSYNITFPNIGSYLKLLHEARAHLLNLLTKSNRYGEMPRDLLKERWDGGVAGSDDATKAQRLRGEWSGVLPGRTKKWKQFCGLEFQWVLEECLGAGMVECFKTGSVGLGVRAI